MEQRISLVTLGVADLERARRFYEGLGWHTNAAAGDDVVFFQAGGMILALWGRDQLAAEVDRVMEEARAAGSTITREAGETFWGGYSGAFADLDGHPWEIAHNPRWTLEPDGSVRLAPNP